MFHQIYFQPIVGGVMTQELRQTTKGGRGESSRSATNSFLCIHIYLCCLPTLYT